MHNKFPLAIVVTAFLALVLSSCAGNDTADEVTKIPETVEPIVVGPIEEPKKMEDTMPAKPAQDTSSAFNERDALLQVNTYYFQYNSSDLEVASDDALNVHAEEIIAKLAQNPSTVVTVEGNTDERGTVEFNNALGFRRAETVSNYLQVKGVPAGNIETVSYGELRPVAEGSEETSWALNRRVVIDY